MAINDVADIVLLDVS